MSATQYREVLLQETREELAKADSKASILLAASGIALSALLTVGENARWYPSELTQHNARIVAWIAVSLTLVGIVVVGAAVKPRLRAKREERGAPQYFGDVEAYWPRWWQWWRRKELEASRREEFRQALKAGSSTKDYDERLDDQIWVLSHIAYRKYRLLSIGMWLYALAGVAALIALALEKQWG